MKIAFFDAFKEIVGKEKDSLGSHFTGHEVVYLKEKLTKDNVTTAADAEVICVFTGSLINKEIIDALPSLKFINTSSTGYDHIDVEHAHTKGIQVSNVPAYGSETVAEFAFALILTLSRKIREANQALKENGDFSIPSNLQGFDLEGKTLGVIGTGKIGKNVIRIAKGFDMNVLAYDMYPDQAFAKENNFTYQTLPEVLSQSDVVTLHAPYTKENHHMINNENISLFKKGAYLINTARGELVENEALLAALKNGILAGAGLDVLEGERGFKKGDVIPMLDMQNVVMTPHVAFDTKEAEARIIQTTIENIKAFISGSPVNLVR